MDLKGEAFLRYVYDELSYQIAKKAEDELIAKIQACGTVSTNTSVTNVAVPIVENTGTLSVFAEAIAELSDRAANPVIMMNKASYATFKALQYSANYPVDIFEGMEVLFNDTIASFATATTGVAYAIVGDLEVGALANFPEGEGISIKYDDLSLAESDLVKIVGREYVGLGVVAPKAFVRIMKDIES
jgi:HK97 family phage major capsid protein